MSLERDSSYPQIPVRLNGDFHTHSEGKPCVIHSSINKLEKYKTKRFVIISVVIQNIIN